MFVWIMYDFESLNHDLEQKVFLTFAQTIIWRLLDMKWNQN